MHRLIALLLCVALAAGLGWLACRTPAPRPPGGTGFSAAQAMADVRAIAQRAHPIGSADHDRVRDDLVGRLRAIGLDPEVHDGAAVEQLAFGGRRFIGGGRVQNIVAVLQGRDRSQPALLLMAHYDTVPASPGAADDTAGVATILQVAERLKAGPTPARDVIVLITDGEEAGLLGARAFFASDPLARHAGAAINLEARGSGARTFMFQTSARNAGLMRLYAHSAGAPAANSLSGLVYAAMPNDTDFTIAKAHGVQGFNLAFMGRPFDYHAASATPASLDQGSLQHMGDQALGLARALAAAPALPAAGPDLVYADLFGALVIAYPPWAGWLVLGLAAAGLAVAFARAFRDEPFAWRRAFAGAGAVVLTALFAVALLTAARFLTGVPHGFAQQLPLLSRFGVYELALAAACLAAAAGAVALVSRGAASLWSAYAGASGVLMLLAIVAQALAPLGAQLIAWPLLITAAIALKLAFLGYPTQRGWLFLAAVMAATALGWLVALAHPVALAVGADLPQPLALLTVIALGPLFPLLWPGGRPLAAVAVIALAAVVALAFLIHFTDPWSARHARPSDVVLVVDADSGRVFRASALPAGDRWTVGALNRRPPPPGHAAILQQTDLTPWARSAVAALGAGPMKRPQAASLSGTRRLTLKPPFPYRELQLWLTFDGAPAPARLNGQPVTLSGQGTRIVWSAPEGLDLVLPAQHGLQARYAIVSEGWPAWAAPLPPRPARVMPWEDSGGSVILGSFR